VGNSQRLQKTDSAGIGRLEGSVPSGKGDRGVEQCRRDRASSWHTAVISLIQCLLFTSTQVPYVEVGIVQSNVCGAGRRLQHVNKTPNDGLRQDEQHSTPTLSRLLGWRRSLERPDPTYSENHQLNILSPPFASTHEKSSPIQRSKNGACGIGSEALQVDCICNSIGTGKGR
jgi:hypothetical protein